MRIHVGVVLVLSALTAMACIWDGDTLENEKAKSPKMADVILGAEAAPPDPRPLRERIKKLRAAPREGDPAWWNDLAGAHIRLGETEEAVQLLAPLAERFPNDYGIHANLGTAYHLLGRYVEAEKHIARDLELNPDAHFGLEKFHLALLQYLMRDEEYRRRHLYVYEWTDTFLKSPPEHLSPPYFDRKATNHFGVDLPRYLDSFTLHDDPKFEEGVLYMASLNSKEPACSVMLGVACCRKRDFNLAIAAFKRAIALGSSQTELLEKKIISLQDFVSKSQRQKTGLATLLTTLVLVGLIIGVVVVFLARKLYRRYLQ